MSWSFIKHVTNHLARPGLSEQKAPTLWPSSATAIKDGKVIGKCRRQAYFRYLKDSYYFYNKYDHLENLVKYIEEKESPIALYTRWIWQQGELYEDYCTNLAKESGVFVATQTSVYVPGYNISGKIDLIVVNPETTKLHIVEVKSVYGFNANSVLGTEAQQRKGNLGQPRDSHLMQLGLYQWWYGNNDDRFAEGLLVYGARDTGRFAEYKLTVEKVDDKDYIFYQGHTPITTSKVNSGISIQSILDNYKYLNSVRDTNEIPPKDYELFYSEDKIEQLYNDGLLSKADTAQFEKRKQQLAEGKKRVVKAVEKGDWQCRFCQYKTICYNEDNNPFDIESMIDESNI
jgi:CRISPR/Cas system-associated exonuclease Cas4 (RecB family)